MRWMMARVALVAAFSWAQGPLRARAGEPPLVPASAYNLLLDAKVSGNLASFHKGLRGKPLDVVYDIQKSRFANRSEWHEYGVGFGADLGVVSEKSPASWLAEWPRAVEANLMVFSGTYPNQPQPATGWKIEVRLDGKWREHARGVGGWYNNGRYVWGGRGTKPVTFDALRISLFSKDAQTRIKSVHFRGEAGSSWVVADVGPIDARIRRGPSPVRAGEPARFEGELLEGAVTSWRWDFGDGGEAEGRAVTHVFTAPGTRDVTLTFSDGKHTARTLARIRVEPSVIASIQPLTAPVLVGRPLDLKGGAAFGEARSMSWALGDGTEASGPRVRHVFAAPGIYEVKLSVSDGRCTDTCAAIVRVHTRQTANVPQVFLDTDQKNEVDDQHYLGYALFSELDVLGVNSIHHGGGQEPINYREILRVVDLAKKSGLPAGRVPLVFRGADKRLRRPASGRWEDTDPAVTAASRAILAAARGASPSNPLWVLPVGPATNVASAILQARTSGLELAGRMRVMWLGGAGNSLVHEFNGGNDPWGAYVMARSGIETWIVPAPVGGRIRMDVRKEKHLYADNPLGRYLEKIVPRHEKAIYDPSCLAAVISLRLGLGWVKETVPVAVAGPGEDYRWKRTGEPSTVRVILRIDPEAMKKDLFDTLGGKARRLTGAPLRSRS